MTREEAINIMSQMIKDEDGFLSDNTVEAHKMAIKALEQEPCEAMERKVEKEYLFESLCEDLKKLQAENETLRNALEQEPCEDAISRKAVLNIVDSYSNSQSNVNDVTQDCISDVIALPSVRPKAEQEPTAILDKIRAEIQDSIRGCVMMGGIERANGLREAKEIIDKYKAESKKEG